MDAVAPKNIKRKPSPKDPLHPTKAEFIRAKHVNLSFILKPNQLETDDNVNLEIELSKQLHASVRSGNLETSLRLLVQGADPNYFHEVSLALRIVESQFREQVTVPFHYSSQEKGSTPLQVAAKFGQASQIELLIVYGANTMAKDSAGNTAYDLAKLNQHTTIAERLLESTYEVTDRLSYFLTGKKPDHSTGSHLLIPEQSSNEISEQLKIARGKLQLIPNKMFEELVMDLYDEVDRRETEASMLSHHMIHAPQTNTISILLFSLGHKRTESGDWCCSIFANESPFECHTKSRTPKIGSFQSNRIRWPAHRCTDRC